MKTLIDKATWIYDLLITAAILTAASLVCVFLSHFAEADTHVPLIFVLAVLCVARFTHGYFFGLLSSLIAVVGVNYAFTYPYFRLDFSLTGYPLTFLVMLTVALIVSTLTAQIKKQEQIRLEIEREKMRSNLLRAISHDIRTPLTSIAGSAAAIIENHQVLTAEDKLTLTRDIRSEAEWLNQMVENILSITRFSGTAATLNKTPELAEEIIESAVMKFRKRHPDISVQVQVPEEPLMIPMDAILVDQVLSNLLENAAVHGKTVTQIRIVTAFDRGMALFTVTDNGTGIPPQILPHLFDGTLPLQEKQSDTRRSMGIGLSVCRAIIDAHGGGMTAENAAGGGARFCFTLPLEEQPDV